MNPRTWIVQIVLGLVSLLFVSGCSQPEAEPGVESEAAAVRIAVIPKGTSHVFWKSVEAGARNAAEELDVEVIWKGPLKENDRAQQIAIVEQFVTEGVDAVVLAPLDENALVRPVRSAHQKGIPVVIFDSAINESAQELTSSFVATDNKAGGSMAGERMVEALNGTGTVAVLRYQVGSNSTMQREEGFLEAIRKAPGIEILVDNQYAGATVGEAIQKSEEMLDILREADGVFAPNESSTAGMLITLRKHQLAGQQVFIGFDSSDELIQGLKREEIDALVVQNPEGMGYEGVKAAVEVLRGESVPARIDTGVNLMTRSDVQ